MVSVSDNSFFFSFLFSLSLSLGSCVGVVLFSFVCFRIFFTFNSIFFDFVLFDFFHFSPLSLRFIAPERLDSWVIQPP